MTDFIEDLWVKLCEAGMPEVMLFLADQSACRCHWKDTALIGDVRVALLADQERNIVRVVPLTNCTGIGLASPKGVDSSNHRAFVHKRITESFGDSNGVEYDDCDDDQDLG